MSEDTRERYTERRPINEILVELNEPIPPALLKTKPATGARNAQQLTYCPWHRVQRLLNDATNGHTSYSVQERTVTGEHVLMTVRITIHAKEGTYFRDGTGIESLNVSSYGDPQSNAESMAFRRAAARFGLGLHLYEDEDAPETPTRRSSGPGGQGGSQGQGGGERGSQAKISASQLRGIRTLAGDVPDDKIVAAINNAGNLPNVKDLTDLTHQQAKQVIAYIQSKK